jgi:hypothetical protein
MGITLGLGAHRLQKTPEKAVCEFDKTIQEEYPIEKDGAGMPCRYDIPHRSRLPPERS